MKINAPNSHAHGRCFQVDIIYKSTLFVPINRPGIDRLFLRLFVLSLLHSVYRNMLR